MFQPGTKSRVHVHCYDDQEADKRKVCSVNTYHHKSSQHVA